MPQPEHQHAAPRPSAQGRSARGPGGAAAPCGWCPSRAAPALDEPTRLRLGRQLRALYDPVIDEALDPRLAELLQQLDADRAGGAAT